MRKHKPRRMREHKIQNISHFAMALAFSLDLYGILLSIVLFVKTSSISLLLLVLTLINHVVHSQIQLTLPEFQIWEHTWVINQDRINWVQVVFFFDKKMTAEVAIARFVLNALVLRRQASFAVLSGLKLFCQVYNWL